VLFDISEHSCSEIRILEEIYEACHRLLYNAGSTAQTEMTAETINQAGVIAFLISESLSTASSYLAPLDKAQTRLYELMHTLGEGGSCR
jgi:hypothetical protein